MATVGVTSAPSESENRIAKKKLVESHSLVLLFLMMPRSRLFFRRLLGDSKLKKIVSIFCSVLP